ncbi:hypothetical protein llap_21628 [Limosa lapponica baueri]|uniref:IgGFc-binding protein N-terminal domain-containing protein n=1 Tax=Limosa lapponica baueri TaxID=1758121 RepID=A0A2I0T2Q5_LIMLA|nr:hypothetical protein llap_21628 [Limosa lapponica baueri]
MKDGEVQKIKVGPNSPLYITSSAPIQVVFFFTGAAGSLKRDPFLLNIPPVSTYCTSYRVVGLPDYVNHLLLVARQEEAHSITFDQKLEKTLSWQEIPGTDFSWASVTMSNPKEIQRVDNQRSPFGLFSFGFDHYLGCGFTGLCATMSHPTMTTVSHPTMTTVSHPTMTTVFHLTMTMVSILTMTRCPTVTMISHPTMTTVSHPTMTTVSHPTMTTVFHPTMTMVSILTMTRCPTVTMISHPTMTVASISTMTMMFHPHHGHGFLSLPWPWCPSPP